MLDRSGRPATQNENHKLPWQLEQPSFESGRPKGSAFSLPGHFHSALLARAIKACAAKLNQRSNGARATAHKTGKTLRDARKGKQGFRRPAWYLWPGKTAPDKWFDFLPYGGQVLSGGTLDIVCLLCWFLIPLYPMHG